MKKSLKEHKKRNISQNYIINYNTIQEKKTPILRNRSEYCYDTMYILFIIINCRGEKKIINFLTAKYNNIMVPK